jgi:hypothetical protein
MVRIIVLLFCALIAQGSSIQLQSVDGVTIDYFYYFTNIFDASIETFAGSDSSGNPVFGEEIISAGPDPFYGAPVEVIDGGLWIDSFTWQVVGAGEQVVCGEFLCTIEPTDPPDPSDPPPSVPEPSALWLVAVGLAILSGWSSFLGRLRRFEALNCSQGSVGSRAR